MTQKMLMTSLRRRSAPCQAEGGHKDVDDGDGEHQERGDVVDAGGAPHVGGGPDGGEGGLG